ERVAEFSRGVEDGDPFRAESLCDHQSRKDHESCHQQRQQERHDDEHLLAHRLQILALQDCEELVHRATSCSVSVSSPTCAMKISSSDGVPISNLLIRNFGTAASRIFCGSAPSVRFNSAAVVTIVACRTCGRCSRNVPSPSYWRCSVLCPSDSRTASSAPCRTTFPRWM